MPQRHACYDALVSNGLASSVGFAVYEADEDLQNRPSVMTVITVVLCVLSLITFPFASYLHRRTTRDSTLESPLDAL